MQTPETEQQRAHRLADEYGVLAEHYLRIDRRRSIAAADKARAWREYAFLAHLLPQ